MKNMIHIAITFPGTGISYKLEAPDFRIGFHGEGEVLQEYIEQNRRALRYCYNELGGAQCEVKFSFEN